MVGAPWRLQGVAALIVTKDDRYLLQLRDNIPTIHMPQNWALFGGFVEAGEDDAEALRRELAEELEFKAPIIKPFMETAYDIPGSTFGSIRKAFFEVPIEEAAIAGFTLHEGQAMKLFSYAEIRAMPNLIPWDDFALHCHARRREVHRLPSGEPA